MNVRPYIHHSGVFIDSEDIDSVVLQLKSGQLAYGNTAQRFATGLANLLRLDSEQVALTASGTQAICLALQVLNVSAGGRVIVPTYACRSILDALMTLNIQPVVLDVDETYCLNPADIELYLRSNAPPQAVIAVHCLGQLVDISSLRQFNIPVIEDCAHVLHNNFRPAGDIAVFSFKATKVITSGEGGALISLTERATKRLHLIKQGYESDGSFLPSLFIGLSDLQAGLAGTQLKKLDRFNSERLLLWNRYNAHLGDHVEVVPQSPGQIPFRFLIRTGIPFPELKAFMEDSGVAIRHPVDPLLHHELNLPSQHFKTAEALYHKTVSLPCYPGLSEENIDYISETVIKTVKTLQKAYVY